MSDEQKDESVVEEVMKFNARELERQMIAEAEAKAQDPTESALSMYHMFLPMYHATLPKLSNRALRRVLNYLVLYPLHKGDVSPANDNEREVMQLVSALVEAKFIVIMDQYRANAEQLYEAAVTPLTEEQEEQVKKELEK